MGKNLFDIAAEDGELFCQCDDSGDAPVLYGKGGSRLNLNLLLKQANNRNLAKQLRGKKVRRSQTSVSEVSV